MLTRKGRSSGLVLGWREWVALPDLGVDAVKVKVDTGARSSSLHAFDLETFTRGRREMVRFSIHPLQRNAEDCIETEAEILEFREVRSSGGHQTLRPVIVTPVRFLDQIWEIELTLATRDTMGFRMLLGREAVRNRFLVDPGRSFYGGRPPEKKSKKKKPIRKGRGTR
ncbi:MAG: ATP-dependent zinc protease [Acidobacteria bacterium]|uniref:ATP-dependent zinc protease n=1 Tax=Candidatus Polarisedimenticola svalbardensis TaxID=2886004 RepID=A0A8J7C2N0_9BACT|nr:ATP-dependent zinc protease [Candidatus Polarisedimenticola svalbardensis]